MKLRIRDNSIRIRLMQSEVHELQTNGEVTSFIEFPNQSSMYYSVKIGSDYHAQFEENHITVLISEEESKKWFASEKELSLSSNIKLSSGKTLKILVEKDLACLMVREDEDDSDAFPNPKQKH